MAKHKILASVILFLLIVGAFYVTFVYGQAPGEKEICVHGNSGHLQDRSVDAFHCGWGIDYDVAFTGSWLQYSIPIESGTTVKAIRVLFTRGGTHYKDGWIRHLHVYDGPYCVKRFDNLYLGQGDPNKRINKLLTMDPILFTFAVGVSILPETKQVEGLAAIVNMEFHNVSAIVVSP